jgi:hypothetical protein
VRCTHIIRGGAGRAGDTARQHKEVGGRPQAYKRDGSSYFPFVLPFVIVAVALYKMPSSSLFLRSSATLVSVLSLLTASSNAYSSHSYALDTTYAGDSFFDGFDFFTVCWTFSGGAGGGLQVQRDYENADNGIGCRPHPWLRHVWPVLLFLKTRTNHIQICR